MDVAGKEANALNHLVGTEHICWDLLREGEGVAARVIKALRSWIPNETRNEILKELDPKLQDA